MPSEHKDVYISTTLGIVITTTLVCGGLTEPILSKMGMRVIGERAAGASPGGDTHVRAEHGDVDHGDLPPLSMGEVMTEVSAEVSAQRSRASNAFFNFIGGDSNEGGAARVERRYEAYEVSMRSLHICWLLVNSSPHPLPLSLYVPLPLSLPLPLPLSPLLAAPRSARRRQPHAVQQRAWVGGQRYGQR
jgi:hypothetical protein